MEETQEEVSKEGKDVTEEQLRPELEQTAAREIAEAGAGGRAGGDQGIGDVATGCPVREDDEEGW